MDAERWLDQRMEVLKMRLHLGSLTAARLPSKVRRQMLELDPNECNRLGEPLLVALIRYMNDDVVRQLRFMNMLLRAGADINGTERRHGRTPLMVAIIEGATSAARLLIEQPRCNLKAQDHLGNTALMYCVVKGENELLGALIDKCVKQWGIDILKTKNCMGHTAEALAIKNHKMECAKLLKRERLQMLDRMHKQLALINLSAEARGWPRFMDTLYDGGTGHRRNTSLPPISCSSDVNREYISGRRSRLTRQRSRSWADTHTADNDGRLSVPVSLSGVDSAPFPCRLYPQAHSSHFSPSSAIPMPQHLNANRIYGLQLPVTSMFPCSKVKRGVVSAMK